MQLTPGSHGFLLSHEGGPAAYTVAAVRQLEQQAADAGVSNWTLMRRAGTVAWKLLQSRWDRASSLTVICGPGNNGGDGMVVAALAAQAGWQVDLVECPGQSRPSEAAAQARQWALEEGCQPGTDWDGASDSSDLVVDALLGTGLDSEVRGTQLQLLEQLATTRSAVLSLDIPSGLHADSGKLLGPAPRSAATLALVATKPGHWTGAGRAHCGEIYLSDLGLSAESFQSVADGDCPLLCSAQLRSELPAPAADAHKGNLGRVLVAGGDEGMGGAALLSAEAALYSGAGLVSAAVSSATVPAILARRPEIMARAVANGQDLEPMLEAADTVVLGPGLGSGARAQQFVQRAVRRAGDGHCRLVVDAGALRMMAPDSRWRSELPAGSLLTPHPGEAAAMLGVSTADIQADRPGYVCKLSEQTRSTVILKGAGTLVAESGRLLGVCPSGNPGMATGGCGDVLAGVAGALLARGMNPACAAQLAVAVHAEAGDRLATLGGTSGLVAGDLVRQIPLLLDDH